MKRRWLVAGAALLVLSACGDDDDDATTDTTAGAEETTTTEAAAEGPATFEVQVDGASDQFTFAGLQYFPDALTVHAGDTVEFNSVFSGEPHTVTFGTLVTDGLAAMDPTAEEEPPELAAIPPLLPDGPGDAVQAAAQPCFLPEGTDPPESDACSPDEQEQPAFDGTQTYYNSGFLEDGQVFSVELADDLAPGDYSWFCTLHRAGMTGTLTVVGPDEDADTPEDVEAAGAEAFAAAEEDLVPVAEAMQQGTLPPFFPEPVPGTVIAGGGWETSPNLVADFGPETVDVEAGGSVTWDRPRSPHRVLRCDGGRARRDRQGA